MVTAAPPTPNGDLHVGHLAGPYLAADLHARYLRLRGVESYYACGSDDHCMYVERKGEAMGLSGEAACRHFVSAIRETLSMAGIEMDLFMVPGASPHFRPLVQELFASLHGRGLLVDREGPSPYCETCRRYLFEADIRGRCPHCDAGVTGNTCEGCGRVNDCLDLAAATCTACGGEPATRVFRRLLFPTHRYAEALSRYHERTVMSPRLRAFCQRLIADGLPDVAVTHVSGWGLPVPLEDPGFAGQSLYVWFEMAARYWAYERHLGDGRAEADGRTWLWRSQDASIVQFFGFDNSFYYAILLPAIYLAFDEGLRLPTAFVTNEFYRLDGQKFSTSRGHSILGRDLLAAAPRDAVRFYLAWTSPEREETDFTLDQFVATVERELVGEWQGWLGELGERVGANGGVAPELDEPTVDQCSFHALLGALLEDAGESYEVASFSPQRLTRVAAELVAQARRFGRCAAAGGGEPTPSARLTGLALELLAAQVLAIVVAPVMPDFAAHLWRQLGSCGPVPPGAWERALDPLPAGRPLGTFPAYFPSLGHRSEV